MDEKNREKKPSLAARGGKGAGLWLLRHPMGALQLAGLLLVVIVVFQNLEPTSIDILFWTLVDIPKLLLLLISMLVGALTWEAVRRLF
ncbi:MAG: hypothetical protein R3292_05995 [Alcanivorax sp.]|nr:hypothetical protein [Alcanivorax sp.]